ncbi:MAG: porin [Geminicoccaceae bacterium]
MKLKNILLGTTAVAGAGLVALTLPTSAVRAAEVKAGGYPDITITGFARFEAFGGEQDDAKLDNSLSRSLDFRNDTEVHVIARAKSEEYGFEYGATIEFEADTNSTNNTDESWLFVRGGWGEVRLGDEDGASDNSTVGGQTVAAGTGGIDGSDAVLTAAPLVFLTNTNDATKIRYYTPSFGGFSVGASYTPTQETVDSGANNGQFFARKNGANAMQAKNVFEGAAVYKGDLGGVNVLASVVGLYGTLKNGAEDNISQGGFGSSSWWGVQGGATVDLFGFKLGGSIGQDNVGDTRRDFFTAGIAYGIGAVNTSLTYGKIYDANQDFQTVAGVDKASNLVLSADYALAPGLVLAGDISWFDNDQTDSQATGTGDTGVQAVGSLRLSF